MTAKFAGKCKNCGGRIEAGEQISWSRELGAYHTGTRCQQTPRSTTWMASQPQNIRDGYRISADDRAELKAMQAQETAEYYDSLPIPKGATPNGLLDL